ncbi:MAG: penicillin-binding protein 2, partial [Campylobacter sp.]|nr:penicillin-binding protein 2 [Campylobacter sp.]
MRLKLVIGVILAVWLILLGRLYYLSVVSNEQYANIAKENTTKTKDIAPTRGQILDTNGVPLAINLLGYSISLAPHLDDDELESELLYINSVFKEQNITILSKEYDRYNSAYNQDFIKVVDFLEYDRVVPYFAKLNLRQNLSVEPAALRHYPYDSLASHVIGYVGRANSRDIEENPLSKLVDMTGRSGIEAFYNEILQGKKGQRQTRVTALNQTVEEVFYTKPTSLDISLHIDIKLQAFLRELYDGKTGAVIVMDIKNGAIIGAGSFPEYSLNQFVTGISAKEWDELINDFDHPFTNKLVNGLYPPGSVIKMGVSLGFLNSTKISKDTKVFCNGYLEYGKNNHKFRCWKSWGHGNINMNDAIRESCDVYFYEN